MNHKARLSIERSGSCAYFTAPPGRGASAILERRSWIDREAQRPKNSVTLIRAQALRRTVRDHAPAMLLLRTTGLCAANRSGPYLRPFRRSAVLHSENLEP